MKIFVCLLIALLCAGYWARPMENSHKDLTLPLQQALHSRTKRQAESLPKLCTCEAVIYAHPNFAGRSLSIRHQNAAFSNNQFDNQVDSIKIYGNCRWMFYSSANFVGENHYLALSNFSSAPSWGGPGDHVSSARVLPPADTRAIALFEGIRYTGRMVILYQSCDDLSKYEFDNQVSSFIILGGSWRLYAEKNFIGNEEHRNTGEYPRKHGIIADNVMSSVKLV